MRYTRRQPTARGRLSLRSRLLAGLITITALFLIVMGVVTTVVLGNIEQDQFNTDLGLTLKESVSEIANLQNGYAAAYINVASRSTGTLSGPSDTASDLQNLLNNLIASRQATAYFLQNPAQTLFTDLPVRRADPDRDLAEDLRRARQQEQPAAGRGEHPAGGPPGQRGRQSGPRADPGRADHRGDPAHAARAGRPLADQPRPRAAGPDGEHRRHDHQPGRPDRPDARSR